MSYILEALKKSQRERELGQVPTLIAAPAAQSPRTTGRPWGLVAVALAGLAVAIALYAALHRVETEPPRKPAAGAVPEALELAAQPDGGAASVDEPAPEVAQVSPVATQGVPIQAAASPPPAPQTLDARRLAETAIRGDVPPRGRTGLPARRARATDSLARADPDTETLESQDPGIDPMDEPASNDWMEMDEEIGPAEPAEPVEPPPPPPARDARPRRPAPGRATLPEPAVPPIPEDLRQDVQAFKDQLRQERSGGSGASAANKARPADPTKLRLPLDVESRLPAFFMTAHIYDADAAKRFVVINALKYIQGDTTREGLKVEEILPDGVVLSFEGNRFYKRR